MVIKDPCSRGERREQDLLARVTELTLKAGVPECFGRMRPRPDLDGRYGPVEIRGEPPAKFGARLDEWERNVMEETGRFVACVKCDKDVFLRCAVLSEMYRGSCD